MLPLHTHAKVSGVEGSAILKVLTRTAARQEDFELSRCLIWMDDATAADNAQEKWAGTVWPHAAPSGIAPGVLVHDIQTPGVVAPGDVIRVDEGSSRVSVLYRRGANSNTLFATERCNSFCVMCSQPPRQVDDHWRVEEMLRTIELVDRDERQLGISGGEPTLLGDDLVVIIYHAKSCLPDTGLHILSNGRAFADEDLARAVCAVAHPGLVWGIPLYSDAPEIHDFVVQANDAWHDTVAGLYNLARHGAMIEIRVVIQQATVGRLCELVRFIFRNLAFVQHVALMGLEPMGFARRNHDSIWVDPVDCGAILEDAVFFLANRGISVSLYNFPLCTMPRVLWPYCRKSISDWKNVYFTQCEHCDVRQSCCGFFRSVGKGWLSRAIEPVRDRQHVFEGEAVP